MHTFRRCDRGPGDVSVLPEFISLRGPHLLPLRRSSPYFTHPLLLVSAVRICVIKSFRRLSRRSSLDMNSTKSFDLLPNELLHLVLAQLLFVDYDMFSHRSSVHFFARRAKATSLSLVCHRWRRVAVPVIYEAVILTSESEAKTLVSMLRHVGPCIKKLRIEGGCGHSIHIILSRIPGLTFICVSLDIRSKQKAGGLCSGLKFINPKYVVLRDLKVLGRHNYQDVQ